MIPIILDTDIGTDVDDALALTLAVRSPEIDILAVTTVGTDACLRAGGLRASCYGYWVAMKSRLLPDVATDSMAKTTSQCRLAAPEDSLKTNRMDFPSKNSMLWISSSTSSRQRTPKLPWY